MLKIIVLILFSTGSFAQAYSSHLHTNVDSSLRITCNSVKKNPDFRFALNLKTNYNIDDDPLFTSLCYSVQPRIH